MNADMSGFLPASVDFLRDTTCRVPTCKKPCNILKADLSGFLPASVDFDGGNHMFICRDTTCRVPTYKYITPANK